MKSDQLKSVLERAEIPLASTTVEKLDAFAENLTEWNRIHNLTGAKTRDAINMQILDSIYPLTFLEAAPKNLLDIGSGAGFPGLILAIAWPDTQTTLCEPLHKRAAFLRFIARKLHLENVTVENRRVETLPARPYALITSRAVTETSALIDWGRPFIAEETQLLFYKGEQVFDEIEGLEACDIELISRNKRNYLWIKDASKC